MDAEKFVEEMLKSAEKKGEEERKLILVKDVDIDEVERLTKELQDKIQKGKI
ncbi:hypothetical protein KY328_00605 [Candidatus Woesearchaeota archaeon]|nr:hypothetical protein [Candidatus Woesearchaeota archaeon]MBW3021397.1 hypothetical protein [Candidatus Woesearchaeota archaeon]